MKAVGEVASDLVGRFQASSHTSHGTVGDPNCSACGGTGFVRPDPAVSAVARCECLKRKIAERRIHDVLTGWAAYADAELEHIEPRDLNQIEALKALRRNPFGSYFLHGYHDGGKTHLLVAQYRHVALAGVPCALRSSKQLADELKHAELDPDFASPVLRGVNLGETFHLFVDDLEKAAPARTDFRAEAIFDLFDTIARRRLNLSVTSNLDFEELAGALKVATSTVIRLERICTKVAV